MNSIEKLSVAKRALSEAKGFDDILAIHDIALAAEKFAQAAKLGMDAQNEAAEVARRAERKAGEMLAQMPKNTGEAGQFKPLGGSMMEPPATLSDLGIDKKESHRWQQIANVPEETFEEYIRDNKESGEITQAGLLRIAQGKPHVSQRTGENEWYTPPEYVEAARKCMGSIDLDPASSEVANRTVKADKFYTIDDDGRQGKWEGNVWMNPPYAQPLVAEFTELVAEKYETGEIEQACVLVNNATETNWFQRMLVSCSALCLVKGRVRFLDKNGEPIGAPLQGQIVLYFGENMVLFEAAFSRFGKVVVV